jgi:Ca2+/Na+ antiporter
MTTDTEQASSARKVQTSGVVARIGYFLRHFLEMCMTMCIGGITLNVLFFWGAAWIGYPDLFERFPEVSLLVISMNLAVPMIAWMRFRGHEWRPTLEMASTSIILATLLIGASSLGIIPESSRLDLLKILACPVMLIPMLLRLDLYTGHHASHQSQAHMAHPADEHSAHAG